MSVLENELIMRLLFENLSSQGNLDKLDEIVASSFVGHSLTTAEELHGLNELKRLGKALRNGFPDLEFLVENVLTLENQVTLYYTASGTQNGQFWDITPTGSRIDIRGMATGHISRGELTQLWIVFNRSEMMHQLTSVSEREVQEGSLDTYHRLERATSPEEKEP